jgi:predicted metal-dependent phosphotriesterase family hydrolase
LEYGGSHIRTTGISCSSLTTSGKPQLTEYTGHGYDYIRRDIVPRLRRREFSETEIASLLVDNPARALTIEA